MKAYILGNGPGLKRQQLAEGEENHLRLKREITIGVNWIPLLYDPDYLVWTDSGAFLNSLYGLSGAKIIGESKAEKWCWDHCACGPDFPVNRFMLYSPDYEYPLSEYSEDGLARQGSCIYSAINLAYVLGFRQLILLGIDFDILDGYLHFYDKEPQSESFLASRGPGDENTKLQLEDLYDWQDSYGIEIFNATENGKLGRFPKITLEESFDIDGTDSPMYIPDFSNVPAADMKVRIEHERHRLQMRADAHALYYRKNQSSRSDDVEKYLNAGLDGNFKVVPPLMRDRKHIETQRKPNREAAITIGEYGDMVQIEAQCPAAIEMPKAQFMRLAKDICREDK